MIESKYNIKFQYGRLQYIYNAKTGAFVQAEDNELLGEYSQKLYEMGILVQENRNEYDKLMSEIEKEIFSKSDKLDITLQLTNRCNFQCVYCYQEREEKTLTLANAKEFVVIIKDILKKYENYKIINIHYFGGEPLLNLPILEFIDENLKNMAAEQKVEYYAHVTTNGSLLTRQVLSNIKFKSIQLTFDGKDRYHNQLRKNSIFKFQDQVDLISNIVENASCTLFIRMNVCKENQSELLELAPILYRKHGDKISIYINRMIKHNPTDGFTMISDKEYADFDMQFRYKMQEAGKKLLLPKVLAYNCSFINGNSFYVDTILNVKQCTGCEHPGCEQKLSPGMILSQKKMLRLDEKCKSCRILPLCLGACEVQREIDSRVCVTEKFHLVDILKNHINNEFAYLG